MKSMKSISGSWSRHPLLEDALPTGSCHFLLEDFGEALRGLTPL
jgi:hypothetical protein